MRSFVTRQTFAFKVAPKTKSVRKTLAVVKQRRWSEEELKMFALVLASDDDNFCHSVETRVLQRSSNNEIFERIKVKFNENLDKAHNQEKIKLQLGNKVKRCPKIYTFVARLRGKYKWLKDQRRKHQDRTIAWY